MDTTTINFFDGTDTYGVHINVGVRADGVMFFRSYRWNGYVTGWGAWQKLDGKKEVYIDCYGKPAIKWGWNELQGCNANIRLPKGDFRKRQNNGRLYHRNYTMAYAIKHR